MTFLPSSGRRIPVLLAVALFWAAGSAARAAGPDIFTAPFQDGEPVWVSFVNDLVGWRPYAEAGFLGSSTVVGNVEAGLLWTGHEVFVRDPAVTNGFIAYTNPHALNELDFHATMVGHVLAGSGFDGTNYMLAGIGMVPQATLVSAAVATAFSTNNAGAFNTSYLSVVAPYRALMTGDGAPQADVINSSWGGPDPAAAGPEALALDGLAAQNPSAMLVSSAGNGGGEDIGWPGSGYNGVTVGALGGNNFLVPADFTSRGLADFSNPVTGVTTTNARAAVHLAAPGVYFFLAAYLGDEGGLSAALPGLTEEPSPTDLYFIDMSGTSFAAPMVAGGAAVLKDAANRDPLLNLQGLSNAPDTRVVKSVLMAGAQATFGWDNGQESDPDGAVRTTQALDAATGAGALELERAGSAYLQGTRDVAGVAGGSVLERGWDFGTVAVGGRNDYLFGGAFGQPVDLTVSLNWFAGRTFDMATDLGSDLSFADLNLEVWEVTDGTFASLVGTSSTVFGNSEYLRLGLSGDRTYGLRVRFDGLVFDQTAGVTSESYGLAWFAGGYDTLFWNGGAASGTWSGLSGSWNTAPPGTSGIGEAVTTGLDRLIIAPGEGSNLTVTVDGPQLARGLEVRDGVVTLTGINGAAISLSGDGLTLGAGAGGDMVLETAVSLLLAGDQAWSNESSFDLRVGGTITGRGDLHLRSQSGGSVVLSGPVGHRGAVVNDGSGTGTNRISGIIGPEVTGVTQAAASGTLVLGPGKHNYAGETTVTAGTLLVEGDISSSVLTTVGSGGLLAGSGRVGPAVILGGGTGSPGNSPGTMFVDGNLTWLGGGNFNWQIHDAAGLAGGATGWDLYRVAGVLDLSALTPESRFRINLWSLATVGPDTDGDAVNLDHTRDHAWTIVVSGLGVSGFDDAAFDLNTVATNGTGGLANDLRGGTFGLRVEGNELQLTYTTAVPEPGVKALGGLVLFLVVVRWALRARYGALRFKNDLIVRCR